jgi:hypothetical protein
VKSNKKPKYLNQTDNSFMVLQGKNYKKGVICLSLCKAKKLTIVIHL